MYGTTEGMFFTTIHKMVVENVGTLCMVENVAAGFSWQCFDKPSKHFWEIPEESRGRVSTKVMGSE